MTQNIECNEYEDQRPVITMIIIRFIKRQIKIDY